MNSDNVTDGGATDAATTVEIRVRASRNMLGLIDHYFLLVDGSEYHPGFYSNGNVLPMGTTSGAHVAERRDLCRECYDKLKIDVSLEEPRRLFGLYYPFLNCESLCTGFSVQSLHIFALPFVVGLACRGMILHSLLAFALALLSLLAYSKYVFSRTKDTRCAHIVAGV